MNLYDSGRENSFFLTTFKEKRAHEASPFFYIGAREAESGRVSIRGLSIFYLDGVRGILTELLNMEEKSSFSIHDSLERIFKESEVRMRIGRRFGSLS